MKTDVLNKVADLLDTVEDYQMDAKTGFESGFCMEDYFHWNDDENGHECQSPSCIAGHILYMTGKKTDYYGVADTAAEIAGLNSSQREELFIPDTGLYYAVKSPWDVTAKEAAKVIRNLVETGKVDWTIVCGEKS